MDSLPYLCRFQYAETAEYLTNLTDPLIATYQSFGSAGGSSDLKQLEMLEGQLTWLVHIIGAVVRGRMNTTGNAPFCSKLGAAYLLLCDPAACPVARWCCLARWHFNFPCPLAFCLCAPAGADAQEAMDGDLAARVFGLLRLVDTGYHTRR